MSYQTVNPANEEILKTYSYHLDKEVESKLEKARAALLSWKKSDFEKRQKLLREVSQLLQKKERYLAEVITHEMGKPLVDSLAEIKKCQQVCDYYAENLQRLLEKKEVQTAYKKTYVSFQPLGVVFGVMPWNFPFWQVFRFAIPALAGGNVVLLKHADITSGCAEEIERLFYEAQVELHLFQNLRLDHNQAAKVISDSRVQVVTVTGSIKAGRQIAGVAAENLKKCVLELGGSDAYIVCEDANLETAVQSCVRSRLINNGQSCVAGKRFFIHRNIFKKFTEMFVSEMSSYVVGDPMNINTKLGPIAHRRFLKNLLDQISIFESLKAKRVDGAQDIPSKGSYITPAVILFDKPSLAFNKEEVFGPVALMTPFEKIEEALQTINQSQFGLGGGIYSTRPEEVLPLLEKEMDVGFAVMNDYVKSDARIPFGGVKSSGYGRELGEFGIYEFINVKTIAIN